MIGMVIIAHGGLAAELLRTAEMIVGPQTQTRAISVSHKQASNRIFQQIKTAISDVNDGHGVLVLTDMFGGTPSNISLSFLGQEEIEVITGVNLPMLIKLSTYREQLSLPELKNKIVEYGRENILIASDMLDEGKEKVKNSK